MDVIKNKSMKKINQYLTFIIWSIAKIILIVIAFIILPILLLFTKLFNYSRNTKEKEHVNHVQTVWNVR